MKRNTRERNGGLHEVPCEGTACDTDWDSAMESKNDFKKCKKHERQSNWKAKVLHGHQAGKQKIQRTSSNGCG